MDTHTNTSTPIRSKRKACSPAREHFMKLKLRYDTEEDNSPFCLGDEASIHKKEAEITKRLLLDILKSLKFPLTSCGPDWDIVRKAICQVIFIMLQESKGHLHPSSGLYGSGYMPGYVVYYELTLTTKEYMQCATSVEPQWLAEFGPMFFSVKDLDTSVLDHKKKQKHEKSGMEEEMEDLRSQQAEAEIRKKSKERENRLKQQQRQTLSIPGLKQGSTCLRSKPKRLGL